MSGYCFLHALIGYSNSGNPVVFTDSPLGSERWAMPNSCTLWAKWLPGLLQLQTKKNLLPLLFGHYFKLTIFQVLYVTVIWMII